MNDSSIQQRESHNADPSLGSTFIGCPMIADINSKCHICNRYPKRYPISNGFEIDLKQEYVMLQQKKKTSKKLLQPIAGDLIFFGWAVYEGINTRNINIVGNLFNDCHNIMHKQIRNMGWNQLQKPQPIKSGRDQFLISMAYLQSNERSGYLGSVVSFYETILTNCLQKIDGFENSELAEGHLLRNRGDLVEQIPHRDYEAVRRVV